MFGSLYCPSEPYFVGAGWEVGRKAWADDDGEDDGEGDGEGDGDDDDDDDLVNELATRLPGTQESGNMYYRSKTIQSILILSPCSRRSLREGQTKIYNFLEL